MKAVSLAFSVLVATTISAQDLPQPSPKGHVDQVVGLTDVKVEYSRPSAKGRVIFGELVKYDALWRTGANLNTTIEFNGPVKFGDVDIEAGKYSLFTVPGAKTWVVKLNKNVELWGEDDYKEEETVASIKVEAATTEFTETLTFEFANLNDDNADLVMRWEKTKVTIPIVTDATKQGIANIMEAMKQGEMKAGGYNGSARFALDRGTMTKEALEWAQKSVAMDPKFWSMHTLARAQAANGLTKDATATAEQSMKMAQEAKNEAYVKMNRELIEKIAKGGK